jgi:hypothetical protein
MVKALTLFLMLLLAAFAASAATQHVSANLQAALDKAQSGDTLIVTAGRYEAEPQEFVEQTCGNCQKHQTVVHASRGFLIHGKQLRILGDPSGGTVLVTKAGYGLLVLDSRGTVLENLVVTGGHRDRDGAATDAAIVVKQSTVKIHNCTLRDNTHYYDSTIVGIGGVMIRENSEVWLTRCRMINNTWDGVALYRGATAMITDCVIDSGRGAGIGVTWDATATCLRNEISHYWKGIGSFGTATVVARNNLVHDNLGWGIIASGESAMIAENNTVVQNGNCGIAIWNAGTRGRMVNNISALNGWRKEWVCPCVGFWNQEGDSVGWVVSHNLVWQNSAGDVRGMDSTKFLMVDPQFGDTLTFVPGKHSAARGVDSTLTNPDGSPGDLGYTGGPAARREER